MLDANRLEAIAHEARNCFLYEDAPDHLILLKESLQKLNPNAYHSEQQNIYKDLERAAHSLKGGAGMAALPTLSRLAHKLEDLFEALQQGRVTEYPTAIELINLAVEEIENLLAVAVGGRDDDNPSNLTLVLEEFLQTLNTQNEQASPSSDISGFIKTALNVDLEDCLAKLERVLTGNPSITDMEKGLKTLEEECTLLGQALSCSWLEQAIKITRQVRESQGFPLPQLITQTIEEIRYLRTQYLENKSPILSPSFTQLLPHQTDTEKTSEVVTTETPTNLLLTTESSETSLAKLNLRIPIERLSNMSSSVGELLINHERLVVFENQLKQACLSLKKRYQILPNLREKIEYLYDQLTIQNETNISHNHNEFDSLEFDKYTEVHSTLQQFQELMVQVQETREDMDLVTRDLHDTLVLVRQYIDNLDRELNQIRLAPFGTVANSFIQPLERLSKRYKKPIKLTIKGDNVLVDRAILEQLRTPLTHLVRNAFDHGIEPPKEREAKGKAKTAEIQLQAAIKVNQVWITIRDDGRGIQQKKVLKKALELGLCNQKEAAKLTSRQILDFIFSPNFSTANTVSDLSGRGMGLDIVRTEIEKLGGTLDVESEMGLGTKFKIIIPLTVNILPLFVVRVQQQLLAIPAESVKKVFNLSPQSIDSFTRTWEAQSIPVVELEKLLPYNFTSFRETIFSVSSSEIGLLLEMNQSNIVVIVSQIVAEKDLVVKAFDTSVAVPPYVIGCTVLGTGQIVPILVPDYFNELIYPRFVSVSSTPTAPEKAPSILIVDDSIAVRRTLNRILSQSGYRVTEARDGAEAWVLLNRPGQEFAIAICDLEMPELDGFSLLQLIRTHESWLNLPVIVLTSRETQLHRDKAFSLGANSYITKPFQPRRFLEEVESFLETP